MSHSLAKVWIHAIWRTKGSLPLLKSLYENRIYNYIKDQFTEMECPVKAINGVENHIHILFQLNQKRSIAEVMKQAKGSCSHYINSEDIIPQKFAWQTGYAAFSVSESIVPKVQSYIKKQKEHHKKQSFSEEYDSLLTLHKIVKRS